MRTEVHGLTRNPAMPRRASSIDGHIVRMAAACAVFFAACAANAAELKSQDFALTPSVTQVAMEFDVAQPMRLHAESSVDVAQQRLVLVVKPVAPSGVNRVSRVENAGRVTIDTDVTAQDLATHGRRWVAIVAATQAPVAAVKGRLVVTDGAAPSAAAPPPAPRVGYVPPPPSASAPLPPSKGLLPPPRSGPPPPPSTAAAPPPPAATTPPPPTGYVPAAARSGRYRLSLLGATVNRKTTDDDPVAIPPVAKRGDDVFFVADMVELTALGTTAPQRRKTPVYGVVPSGNSATQAIAASLAGGTRDRIQAGTMTVDGGLKAGDTLPYAQPWMRKAPITADRLPMLVWEGTLAEGRNILLVTATVWEFDDGGWTAGRYRNFSASAADMSRLMLGDLRLTTELFNTVNDIARTRGPVAPLPEQLNPQVLARFSSGAGSPPAATSGGLTGAVSGAVVSNSSDRPIGLRYQNGQPVFVPNVLLLNYANAERLVTAPATPVPSIPLPFGGTSVPMPQGTVLVQYRDDDRLGGDYVLILQLERAP